MATPTATETDVEMTHQKPRYDDINVPVVAMWGFISLVATLVTILIISGIFNIAVSQWEQARQSQYVNQPARDQVEAQKERLLGGGEAISIEMAKEKVVQKFGGSAKSH